MPWKPPFKSRQVEELTPETPPVPTMGWSEGQSDEDALLSEAAREAKSRREGTRAAAALLQQQQEAAKARMDARLAGVARGHDFRRPPR